MKCPHCGIEVRDTMTVCMYCGNKIPQRRGATPPPAGKVPEAITRTAAKSAAAKKTGAPEDEAGEDEEEGGLSACLQPGEQVLIGSLNISVKKFLFHAYLTDRRIFLIDTQEKKIRVTAKDIPLDTITGTTVEFSENSDPVLVLSIRSADDEIKTMKLVFAGNGMDRSDEIDEWVELLSEQTQPKRQKKPSRKKQPEPDEETQEQEEPAGEEEEEIPAPVRPQKAMPARQELRPAKRPVKDHEKQPPVKRLLSLYQTAPQEEEEPAPAEKPAKPALYQGESRGKPPARPAPPREIPPAREPVEKMVKKVEVQSVMKGALKGALQPVPKPGQRPVPVKKQEPLQPEPPAAAEPGREPLPAEETGGEEAESPIFCQNCGKKLPSAANFCPGCGTKITAPKEKHPVKVHEKSPRKHEESGGEPAEEQPRPQRAVAKKGPKGSEMTILHKFLRR